MRASSSASPSGSQVSISGYLLIFIAASLWGLIGPLSHWALSTGMNPTDIALWRTVFSWLVFCAQALVVGRAEVHREHRPLLLAFGLLTVTGLHGLYVVSVREGGSALSAVLLYTAPAWVALLSRLILGEVMTWGKMAAVGLTLAGVMLVGGEDLGMEDVTSLGNRTVGILCGLGAGVSYALGYIFAKSGNSCGNGTLADYPPATLFVWAYPPAIIVLAALGSFQLPPVQAWVPLVLLGTVATWLPATCYFIGMRRVVASRAAVVATVEPVVAAALGVVLFGERLGLYGWLGGALVIAGVLVGVAGPIFARRPAPGYSPK